MKLQYAVLFVLALNSAVQAQAPRDAVTELKTTTDQASYAIGVNIGRELQSSGSLNVAAVLEGIRDILSDSQPRLSDEQCRAALMAHQRAEQARWRAVGEKNKVEGPAFLTANRSKPGVQTLPSGLQYKVIKTGTGRTPQLTDTVVAHYHGTLVDGTVFDSSVERKQPSEFPVNGVIRGWTEALQMMKVGSKWQLFIPSDLAYGPGGRGQLIAPHSVLVFEVELLGVK